jgi:hypothetical protein
MQRRLVASLIVCATLPAAAWGISSLRAKREADAFYAWRTSAAAALTSLTQQRTTSTKPRVQGSDNASIIALASEHRINLLPMGDVLRVPTNTLIEIDRRAVLALVAGPVVEGQASCMVLDEQGQVSFVLEGMLRSAMKQAIYH